MIYDIFFPPILAAATAFVVWHVLARWWGLSRVRGGADPLRVTLGLVALSVGMGAFISTATWWRPVLALVILLVAIWGFGFVPPCVRSQVRPSQPRTRLHHFAIATLLALGLLLAATLTKIVLYPHSHAPIVRWTDAQSWPDVRRAVAASRAGLGILDGPGTLAWFQCDPGLGGDSPSIPDNAEKIQCNQEYPPFKVSSISIGFSGELSSLPLGNDTPAKPSLLRARPFEFDANNKTFPGLRATLGDSRRGWLFEARTAASTPNAQDAHTDYVPIAALVLGRSHDGTERDTDLRAHLLEFLCSRTAADQASAGLVPLSYGDVRYRGSALMYRSQPLPGTRWMPLIAPTTTALGLSEQEVAERFSDLLREVLDRRSRSPGNLVRTATVRGSDNNVFPSVEAFVRGILCASLVPQPEPATVNSNDQSFRPAHSPLVMAREDLSILAATVIGGSDWTGWIQFVILGVLVAALLSWRQLTFAVASLASTTVPNSRERMFAEERLRARLTTFGFFKDQLFVLGFFGTLLGITLAFSGGIATVFRDADLRTLGFRSLFSGLAVAFNTSIVGVFASLASAYLEAVYRRQEAMVNALLNNDR